MKEESFQSMAEILFHRGEKNQFHQWWNEFFPHDGNDLKIMLI